MATLLANAREPASQSGQLTKVKVHPTMAAEKEKNTGRRGAKVSCRKGGARSRKTAHQNRFAFKHNKNSVKTARLAKIPNKTLNCCPSCKRQIEWKVKYRKFKPMKNPRKCNACGGKGADGVLHAYHTVCSKCAKKQQVCAKCTTSKDEWLEGSETEDEGTDEEEAHARARKTRKSCRRRGVLAQANAMDVAEVDRKSMREIDAANARRNAAVGVVPPTADPFAVANNKRAAAAAAVDPFAAANAARAAKHASALHQTTSLAANLAAASAAGSSIAAAFSASQAPPSAMDMDM
jgi:hypothetical protein